MFVQEDISKEHGVREVEVHLLPGEERLGLNLIEESDGSLTIKAIGPGKYIWITIGMYKCTYVFVQRFLQIC